MPIRNKKLVRFCRDFFLLTVKISPKWRFSMYEYNGIDFDAVV